MGASRTAARAACLCAALWGGAALAEPAIGTWKTEPGDDGNYAHVRVYTCGAALCGVLERAYDSAGQPMQTEAVGKRMIWDMIPQGDGSYGGGRIWAPDRDRVYRSKMQLSGSRLSVSGCVGPICRAQAWERVD